MPRTASRSRRPDLDVLLDRLSVYGRLFQPPSFGLLTPVVVTA